MVESLQGPLFSFPSFFFFQSFFVPSSMQLRYSLHATVSHLLITDSHCRYLLSREGKIPIPIMTLGVGEAQDKEGLWGFWPGDPCNICQSLSEYSAQEEEAWIWRFCSVTCGIHCLLPPIFGPHVSQKTLKQLRFVHAPLLSSFRYNEVSFFAVRTVKLTLDEGSVSLQRLTRSKNHRDTKNYWIVVKQWLP